MKTLLINGFATTLCALVLGPLIDNMALGYQIMIASAAIVFVSGALFGVAELAKRLRVRIDR